MAGDTAKLLASLDLQDAMSPKLRTAIAGVSAAEGRIGSLSSRLSGFASNLKGNVGNALTSFGGRIKQVGLGLAGLLGVGGILSIGGVIGGSVHKLEEFSLALEKIQTVTGETARDSGTLILLFEKFGLSLDQVGMFAGFAEKTLGKLNAATVAGAKATKSAALVELERIKNERTAEGLSTKKISALIREQKATDALTASLANAADGTTKLQALDKQYGLALIDSKGKTVSYSEELRQLADFYDRNHDAAQRAYVASMLLGRGYAALAPILNQGSAAIREAANEADALGLGSQDTADQIVKFRTQMRDLGVQANVLQLQIGMALIPTISHFAKDLSSFITAHRTDVIDFFRNAGQMAENVAGTIGGLVGTIGAFWNTIPAPFRDLLVKGIVADRTVKFLFGFSPIGSLASAIEGGFAKAVGTGLASAGVGKLFVQPVFVTNPGFGAGGLVEAGEAAAAGAGVSLGMVLAAIVAIPAAIAAANVLKNAAGITDEQQHYLNTHGQFGPRTQGNAEAAADRTAAANTEAAHQTALAAGTVAMSIAQFGRGISGLTGGLNAGLAKFANPPWLAKWIASLHPLNAMSRSIAGATAKLEHGIDVVANARFLGSHLGTTLGSGGLAAANKAIADLTAQLARTNDPATRRALIDAIGKIEHRLPRLADNAKNLALAQKIASSGESQKQKLADLAKIMDDVRIHGGRITAARIAKLIAAVKAQKLHVNVTIPVRITNTGRTYRVTATGMSSVASGGARSVTNANF